MPIIDVALCYSNWGLSCKTDSINNIPFNSLDLSLPHYVDIDYGANKLRINSCSASYCHTINLCHKKVLNKESVQIIITNKNDVGTSKN